MDDVMRPQYLEKFNQKRSSKVKNKLVITSSYSLIPSSSTLKYPSGH